MKSVIRNVKNSVLNYEPSEIRIREATSNEPYGASMTLMDEIANDTFKVETYNLVLTMLLKRLTDYQHLNHVHKALNLTEYLLKHGDLRFLEDMKTRKLIFKRLKRYKFYKNEHEIGECVRTKARIVYDLLGSDELEDIRAKASRTKMKIKGVSNEDIRSAVRRSHGNGIPPLSTEHKHVSPSFGELDMSDEDDVFFVQNRGATISIPEPDPLGDNFFDSEAAVSAKIPSRDKFFDSGFADEFSNSPLPTKNDDLFFDDLTAVMPIPKTKVTSSPNWSLDELNASPPASADSIDLFSSIAPVSNASYSVLTHQEDNSLLSFEQAAVRGLAGEAPVSAPVKAKPQKATLNQKSMSSSVFSSKIQVDNSNLTAMHAGFRRPNHPSHSHSPQQALPAHHHGFPLSNDSAHHKKKDTTIDEFNWN